MKGINLGGLKVSDTEPFCGKYFVQNPKFLYQDGQHGMEALNLNSYKHVRLFLFFYCLVAVTVRSHKSIALCSFVWRIKALTFLQPL